MPPAATSATATPPRTSTGSGGPLLELLAGAIAVVLVGDVVVVWLGSGDVGAVSFGRCFVVEVGPLDEVSCEFPTCVGTFCPWERFTAACSARRMSSPRLEYTP